jgi:signal transduction histidine kinase
MFFTMVLAIAVVGVVAIVLNQTGLIDLGFRFGQGYEQGRGLLRVIPALILFSIITGTAIAAFFSKRAVKQIHSMIHATQQVAEGNFSVRVDGTGVNELEELAHSFNKMTAELSSIETLRSDFINNFSHEFKTPIVSIRGFAKLLKGNDLTDAEKQEYLDIIVTESERLSELSTNVLNLSKYESIEIITEKAPFRLDEQIRRAILLTEPKWQAKNLDIRIEMDEIVWTGNENLTQQIWINLLDNAIKFSKQDGVIEVHLADLSDSISFSVQDDGLGMDEETRRNIFDKFYQGDRSHQQSGNGLGLPMVKRIVELHDGTIQVDSSPDAGSVFSVILPK